MTFPVSSCRNDSLRKTHLWSPASSHKFVSLQAHSVALSLSVFSLKSCQFSLNKLVHVNEKMCMISGIWSYVGYTGDHNKLHTMLIRTKGKQTLLSDLSSRMNNKDLIRFSLSSTFNNTHCILDWNEMPVGEWKNSPRWHEEICNRDQI